MIKVCYTIKIINPERKKLSHPESNIMIHVHSGTTTTTIQNFTWKSRVILILENKDDPAIWVEDLGKDNEEDKKLHMPRGKWRKCDLLSLICK